MASTAPKHTACVRGERRRGAGGAPWQPRSEAPPVPGARRAEKRAFARGKGAAPTTRPRRAVMQGLGKGGGRVWPYKTVRCFSWESPSRPPDAFNAARRLRPALLLASSRLAAAALPPVWRSAFPPPFFRRRRLAARRAAPPALPAPPRRRRLAAPRSSRAPRWPWRPARALTGQSSWAPSGALSRPPSAQAPLPAARSGWTSRAATWSAFSRLRESVRCAC